MTMIDQLDNQNKNLLERSRVIAACGFRIEKDKQMKKIKINYLKFIKLLN